VALSRWHDSVRLARQILERCGYLDTYRLRPRLDLAALLKQYGLAWHRRPFTNLAGALIQVDGAYHVVTNSRERSSRQRFSAAHELKHFLTDRHLADIFYCSRTSDRGIERAANIFARELLMPAETVRFLWERGFYGPEEIGRVLGVSFQAAAHRLEEVMTRQVRIRWE